MYHKLFIAQTNAIEGLQTITSNLIKAHQQVEEMYISCAESEIVVLPPKKKPEKVIGFSTKDIK